jgi:hypothetical protein
MRLSALHRSLRSFGQEQTITWNDGTVHPVNPPFDQPYSFFIAELFKIVNGKINRIEALVTPVPYGMYTSWRSKDAAATSRF